MRKMPSPKPNIPAYLFLAKDKKAPIALNNPLTINRKRPGMKKFWNGDSNNISVDIPTPDPLGSKIIDKPAGIPPIATNACISPNKIAALLII